MAKKDTYEDLSFEQALGKLEDITRGLESGESDLEKSITNYEEGSKLIKLCEKKLSEAKLKVQKIVKDGEGNATLENFED